MNVASDYDSIFDRVVTDIATEVARLKAKRRSIDEDIAKLEAMLATSSTAPVGQGGDSVGEPGSGSSIVARSHALRSSDARDGLREPDTANAVARRAWEILRDSERRLSRGDLFRAVRDAGVVVPGTNAIKNFGNILARSPLIGRSDEGYFALNSADP